MNSVLSGKDVLALLPTGGGKSVCYQVPGMIFEGVCIVVSPLIALMKDQVEALKRKSITAEALFSGLPYREIDRILDNCVFNKVKFLYVAPERLKSDLFLERFKKMTISLIAIDEAHCISEWGYDFRPSYLNIHEIRDLKPSVPCIALSATATPKVQEDIQAKLKLKNAEIFRAGFSRKNLNFSCYKTENKQKDILRDINRVEGQGIVYVRSRKAAKELSVYFQKQQASAVFYHAGMTQADRQQSMEKWLKNEARVMVATNAFGMGIDKDNVRFVFHYDVPESLEAYYQEAGRAGRDEKKAYAVALFNKIDLEELEDSVERKYPPVELIKRVYQALANYYKIPVGGGEFAGFSFDIQDFAGIFGLPVSETHYALKLLEEEGFIQLSENFNDPAKLHFLVDNRQLYDFQIRYQEMDSFIKVLLRIYGGELFTEYVRISESELAQIYFAPVAEVIKKLTFLKERDIVVYEPRRDKPQLTFLTPRYDATLLPLNIFEIEKKKQRDRHKAKAVINYASNTKRCRTILLLEYFNEFDGKDCGVCDVCLANKKKEPVRNEELIKAIIAYINLQTAATPKELSQAFENIPEESLFEILRSLLEAEILLYNQFGQLTLNSQYQF